MTLSEDSKTRNKNNNNNLLISNKMNKNRAKVIRKIQFKTNLIQETPKRLVIINLATTIIIIIIITLKKRI